MAADTDYKYTLPYEVVDAPIAVQDYYVAPPPEPEVIDQEPIEPVNVVHRGWFGGPGPSPSTLDKAAEGINRGITVMQAGDPVPYVFGRTTVTPQIITAHADGDYLYVDYMLSAGECEAIISLTQGGEDIGKPSTGFEYFLGTSGQSASTLMAGALGSTYDALPDICHFVAKLGKDDSMDFRVVMEGVKTRDPRLSPTTSTAYSTNPALALARIFSDCGYTLNWDSVATVADNCDADVSGSKRWEVNLPIYTRQAIYTYVNAFSQYASCVVDVVGGSVTLIPDAPVTSSPSILRNVTTADIVQGSAKTKKVGTRDVPKQVTVTYREENGTQRTAVVGSGASGEKTRLQLPGIQTFTMGKRKATEVYNKARADLRHEHVAHDTALSDAIGDLHSITYAPHGISAKVMRVIGLKEIDRGRWKRSYIEYDAGLYSDSTFTEPTVSDTDLPNPNTPPTGPAPTVVEELFTDQTATTYSRLKVTFTGVDWPYTQAYKVTADGEQNVLNALVAHDGQVTHTVYTAALKQGVTYTIKVYVQSSTGALSTVAGQTTEVALGKSLPPSDVPSLDAYEAGSLVAMSWGAAEEITGDLRGYIIKRLPSADYLGTSADWTHTNAVTIADRVDATTFLTSAQPAGDWYYGLKAIDTTGNTSENAIWSFVTVTVDAGSVSTTTLTYGSVTNMHIYTIDGDAVYAITSTGETWADRFGDTSPFATWDDAVTSSPAERWGGDLATDSYFETEIWALGANKSGNWTYDTINVTLLGGTQSNITALGDSSSPISWANHSGNAVQASGYNFKAIMQTTDSPASAGDGLHIKLPISANYAGKVVEQTGTAVIAATSPLDNPKSITFTTSYSSAPEIQLTVNGSTAKIAAKDNVTATGFDLYLWDTAGAKVDGSVDWAATGT